MKTAIVILAGGEGRRIGGNKPLRMLGGKSLLQRAVEYSRGLSDFRAIAARDSAQVLNADCPLILDDASIEGPLSGLFSALRFAGEKGADAALTIPVDMPFLPADLSTRLTGALGKRRAAIASSGGHLHPVCGLWATGALDVAAGYLATGSRSLKGFASVVGYVAVDWPADSIDPFFNINGEEDLAAAERLLGAPTRRK